MTLFSWIDGIVRIIGDIVPVILSLMVVAFIFNVIRFFILNSGKAGNKEKGIASGRQKARQYLVWSIIGFVITFGLWGIVNILAVMFGIGLGGGAQNVDYMGAEWEATCPITDPAGNPTSGPC